jgi:hypothetical protein
MRRSDAQWNAAFMRQNATPEEICPAPDDEERSDWNLPLSALGLKVVNDTTSIL